MISYPPVRLSSGEYKIDAANVAEIGGGDIGAGTKMLREIVMRQREKFARKLKKLPKPK